MVDQDPIQLREGMNVVGADSEKLGEVEDVRGNYIVVKKGFLFTTEYFVPSNAVNNVDDESLYLNVTKDEATNMGWDAEPADFNATYADAPTTGAGYGATAAGTAARPAHDEDRPFDHDATGERAHVDDNETIRVPLSEEELTTRRRDVERGGVRVEKDVIETEQEMDVPIREEQVNVSRRQVDRDVGTDEAAFQEGSVEVPLRGEEVDVEKRARVTEEVELSKEPVERTEHVRDTVRREEAHIEGEGDAVRDDDATTGGGNRRKNKNS